MKKIIRILLICFPICLNAQQNSLEINTGGIHTLQRVGAKIILNDGYSLGYHLGAAITQALTEEIAFRYGFRIVTTKKKLFLDENTFNSIEFQKNWSELFVHLHHNLKPKGLFVEYGFLLSLLNKEVAISKNANTIKVNQISGFNLRNKVYLNSALGYQYNITPTWQPFVQAEFQYALSKIAINPKFQPIQDNELRSVLILGCRYTLK
jgi:hypothetical protein